MPGNYKNKNKHKDKMQYWNQYQEEVAEFRPNGLLLGRESACCGCRGYL